MGLFQRRALHHHHCRGLLHEDLELQAHRQAVLDDQGRLDGERDFVLLLLQLELTRPHSTTVIIIAEVARTSASSSRDSVIIVIVVIVRSRSSRSEALLVELDDAVVGIAVRDFVAHVVVLLVVLLQVDQTAPLRDVQHVLALHLRTAHDLDVRKAEPEELVDQVHGHVELVARAQTEVKRVLLQLLFLLL